MMMTSVRSFTYWRPGDDCRELGAVAADQLFSQVLGVSVRVGQFTHQSAKYHSVTNIGKTESVEMIWCAVDSL
jgi:hypothetical protein